MMMKVDRVMDLEAKREATEMKRASLRAVIEDALAEYNEMAAHDLPRFETFLSRPNDPNLDHELEDAAIAEAILEYNKFARFYGLPRIHLKRASAQQPHIAVTTRQPDTRPANQRIGEWLQLLPDDARAEITRLMKQLQTTHTDLTALVMEHGPQDLHGPIMNQVNRAITGTKDRQCPQ